MLYYCEHGGVDLMGLKPNPFDLSAFSALTLLVGSFDLHRVSKKTSTHIIGYKLRNSGLILIIFDIKIPHII